MNHLLVRAITGFSAVLLTAGLVYGQDPELVYGQDHKPSSPHPGSEPGHQRPPSVHRRPVDRPGHQRPPSVHPRPDSRPVHKHPPSVHPRPGYWPPHRYPPSVHWPGYWPPHHRYPPSAYWPAYRPGYWRPPNVYYPRPGYRPPPVIMPAFEPATSFHRHSERRPGFIVIRGQRVPGESLPATSDEESLPSASPTEMLPGANTGESLPATSAAESLPGGSGEGLQVVRYLHVSNGTGESLRVYVQLPEEDRPRSWTLAPGEKAPLLVDGEPLATDQVQIWAESPTRHWVQYKDEALVVVAEPYQADQIGTWTEVFR